MTADRPLSEARPAPPVPADGPPQDSANDEQRAAVMILRTHLCFFDEEREALYRVALDSERLAEALRSLDEAEEISEKRLSMLADTTVENRRLRERVEQLEGALHSIKDRVAGRLDKMMRQPRIDRIEGATTTLENVDEIVDAALAPPADRTTKEEP